MIKTVAFRFLSGRKVGLAGLAARALATAATIALSAGAQFLAGAEPTTAAAPRLPQAGSARWLPAVTPPWQWQLDTPVDQTVQAALFDIDLFDNDATVVEELHRQGRKVVCYVDVGSWEDWRPDARDFPAHVLGKNYAGQRGEKWLDIRQIEALAPIMRARLDQCRAKGFDAVEPDNIDGYTNDTGFPLTAEAQLRYNRWLSAEAHARGLSIGLKNDPDQVPELLPYFDWALTEDCFAQDWCAQLTPFVLAGKPVFAAEYTDTGITLDHLCPDAHALKFNVILKHRKLDAWRKTCP